MNSNKGFTLIELIGVIMIISTLSLIFIPKLIYQFKEKNENINSITEDIIKDGAEKYLDNNENYSRIGTYCISISTLVANDYLDDSIYEKESIIKDKIVKAVGNGKNFDLSIVKIDECED